MTTKSKGKTLADFRAAHDKNIIIPTRLKAALAEMEKEGGAENWCYENEMMKRAGISTTDLSTFRDQFAAHVVDTGGHKSKRVWIASTLAAKKFRA